MADTHNSRVQLTQEGYDELKAELQKLQDKLPDAINRVAKAREHGDLSENSEYHAAREDLSFAQGRIEELEELLAHAKVIKNGAATNGKVNLGSKVTVTTQNGQKVTFTIVGEYEADPTEKKISHDSPLGKALLGREPNERVEFEAPVGTVVYTVEKVH